MSDKNPICHHKFSAFQKFATGCDKCHLEVTPYKLGMLFSEVKCLKNELVLAAEDEAELNARITELEAQLASSQSKSQWVSVEDRLPESRVNVLIGRDDNVGHAKFNGHSWTIISSNDVVAPYLVTHWMPLPEPPQ